MGRFIPDGLYLPLLPLFVGKNSYDSMLNMSQIYRQQPLFVKFNSI